MYAELVALVCADNATADKPNAPESCEERVVLSTDINPDFDWGVCLFHSQQVMAQWKETGQYAAPRFRVAKYQCFPDRKHRLSTPL